MYPSTISNRENMKKTFVIKRNGKSQEVSFDKVSTRIKSLCENLEVDPVPIAQKVISQIYDGVHTSELDELAGKICASLETTNPDYGELAKRIIISNNHKNTSPSFSETMGILYRHKNNGKDSPIISKELYDMVMKNKEKINNVIDYQRDYNWDYFGFKTLEKAYLKKVDGKIVERIQDMIMRVSLGLHLNNLKNGLKSYELMSQKYFTQATPTLFHSGTPRPQNASCFTEDMEVCVMDGVKKIKDVNIGDFVVTHTGNIKKITQKHINELGDRKLLELSFYKGKNIEVTNNHRFWAIKNKNDKPNWYRIDELNDKSYIGIPNKVDIEDIKETIDLADYNELFLEIERTDCNYETNINCETISIVTKFRHSNLSNNEEVTCSRKHNDIKRYWKLNEDFYFLIGCFLGDGHVMTTKTKKNDNIIKGIGFTFNSEDKKLIEKIKNILSEITGLKPVEHKMKKQKTYQVMIGSPFIGVVFNELFGKYFDGKKLPEFVFKSNKNKINNLIAGLISTDGCVTQKHIILLQLSNYNLVNQIFHILRINNIDCSFRINGHMPKLATVKPTSINIPYNQDYMDLVIKNYDDNRMEEMKIKNMTKKIRNQFDNINIDGNKFLKIKNIKEIEPKSDLVYTLGVEDDHSYNVEGVLCENCYLIGTEDSISGIYKTITDCAQISKWAGGIGVHVSNIRSNGTYIRGTDGRSDGVVPMLKVYNDTAKYVNQCFTPDTLVFTKDKGVMRMDKIKAEQEMVTKDGSYRRINKVFVRKLDKPEELICYESEGSPEPIKCTKQHQIYCLDQNGFNIGDTYVNVKAGTVRGIFKSASELGENDYIGFPIPQYTLDYPDESLDFYYLYGAMINYGRIETSYDYKMSHLTKYFISLDPSYDDHQIKLKKIKKILDKQNIKYSNYLDDNKLVIYWKKFTSEADITHDMLYESGLKRIDPRLLNLPSGKLKRMLSGMMDNTYQIKTTSHLLVHGIRYLFLRLGVLVSGSSLSALETDKIYRDFNQPTDRIYTLDFPWDQSLEGLLDDRKTLFEYTRRVDKLGYFIVDGIIYTRITKITNIQYDGNVYDFNMSKNHNYLTHGGLVHNSGKRPGAFAIYLEPHHPDIEDFLELGLNQGAEDKRARDLFYAIWASDLFMKRVEADEEWSLFDPDECPDLNNVYGDEYDELYHKYEKEGKAKKVVKARNIWNMICDEQIERGFPYVLFKDHINRKSNQQHYGIIRSSNLCAEITLYSDHQEYAVCVLASLSLPAFIKDGRIDHNKLAEVAGVAIRNLDRIVDVNWYPTPETEKSNKLHRPLGLGVQGLADMFALLDLPFDSPEAKELNKQIFETIYYGAVRESCELAKEYGPYPTFEGSPMSEGRFQFDLWGVKPSNRWDWETLRQEVMQHGVRNSTLCALMPTASTSQILGNNECFEAYTSNIYARRTMAGDFVIVNKHLVKKLKGIGLWDPEIKDMIIANNGSIQSIEGIPQKIKDLFKTVWEIKQKDIMEMSADRAPFICQTQSLNLHFEEPNRTTLTKALFYAWKKGLKTGSYYIRSRPKVQAQQFTIDPEMLKIAKEIKKDLEEDIQPSEALMCSLKNPAACEMCSG